MLEVANGNADVGIVRLPVLRRDARVRFVEMAAERLCAAVPAGHPLAKQKRTTVARLRREPFVSAVYRERGGLARVVIDLCLKRGFVPATARIVSPKTSMLNLVAAGRGVAIVPERMASIGIDGVVFVPIADEDAKSVCALVLPAEPTVLADAFVRLMRAGGYLIDIGLTFRCRHMLTVRPKATLTKMKAPSTSGQTIGGRSRRVTMAVAGDDWTNRTCSSNCNNASRL